MQHLDGGPSSRNFEVVFRSQRENVGRISREPARISEPRSSDIEPLQKTPLTDLGATFTVVHMLDDERRRPHPEGIITEGPDVAALCATLRSRRLAAGLSRHELAARADCSPVSVERIERGYVPSRSDVLPRLCTVLDHLERGA